MNSVNPRFRNDLHVPRVKPFSNDTWEASAALSGAIIQSEQEPIVFPSACRIVGIYPSITLNDSSGLVVPTTDDILVNLSMNKQRNYTANVGQTSQARNGDAFVTLAALNTAIRDLNIEVLVPRPQASMAFRWKRFIQGTPIYRDVIVSLALFVEIDD
jgi:hypothetical protein